MWDWERASVPYRPIYRRRLLRRRVVTALIVALIAIPAFIYHRHQIAQPIGQRVFDEVVSTVSVRYFDSSYHGVAWQAVAQRYRPLIVNAPSAAARYAALRSMLAQLHDSHTAVYSPDDLQPARDGGRHAVFGMVPDSVTNASPVDWKNLAPGIGYLRLSSFPDSMRSVLQWALHDVGRNRALVLDLRGNPGGLVDSVDAVAGIFLPKGTLISTGTRRYNFFGSEQFRATDDAGFFYPGHVVVLIDNNSRSGAESLARALQYYHRATLVGTRTAGKVLGVDAEMALADGGLLRVATLDMRAPDGQRLEGLGVTPEQRVTGWKRQLDEARSVVASDSTTIPSPQPAVRNPGWISSCPVQLLDLSVSSIGSTQQFVEYRIGIRWAGDSSADAQFVLNDDASNESKTVAAEGINSKTNAIVFYWPHRTLKSVGLSSVTTRGKQAACNSADVRGLIVYYDALEQEHKRGVDAFANDPALNALEVSLRQAARSFIPIFDDSKVTLESPAKGQTLHDGDMVRKLQPDYPLHARDSGQQGGALVAVLIGPGGRMLSTKLIRSSGFTLLDDASLRAARAAGYSEPLLGGQPAARYYVFDYYFELH